MRRRRPACHTAVATLSLGAALAAMATVASPAERTVSAGAFVIEHRLLLPGAPDSIFDAITGDIFGWWDHTFTEGPVAQYIEPRPGGGFYEIFDSAGNGARHATVIYADRGKRIRFEGPMGLSGNALSMVHTIDWAPQGVDSTLLSLTVSASGVVGVEWPAVVDTVWYHFPSERFKPFIEPGEYRLKRAVDGSP